MVAPVAVRARPSGTNTILQDGQRAMVRRDFSNQGGEAAPQSGHGDDSGWLDWVRLAVTNSNGEDPPVTK